MDILSKEKLIGLEFPEEITRYQLGKVCDALNSQAGRELFMVEYLEKEQAILYRKNNLGSRWQLVSKWPLDYRSLDLFMRGYMAGTTIRRA